MKDPSVELPYDYLQTLHRDISLWLVALGKTNARAFWKVVHVLEKCGYVQPLEVHSQRAIALADGGPHDKIGKLFLLDRHRDNQSRQIFAAVGHHSDKGFVIKTSTWNTKQTAAVLGISERQFHKLRGNGVYTDKQLGRIKHDRTHVTYDAEKVLDTAIEEWRSSVVQEERQKTTARSPAH